MRVGLLLPLLSGDAARVLRFARRAEELGFDGVFAFDHLFPPGASRERASLEAFSTLAAVAAATERLTVGTLVARASLRSAGLLAKLATSLDDVSGGRMILGIGTGDPSDEPEHHAYGLPYLEKAERRRHTVETVRAVKGLLRGEPWAGGDHVPAVRGPLLPQPRRPAGPPIWVGGVADAVVQLAGAEADAWNGWGLSIPAFAKKVGLLRRTAAEHGRTTQATWAGIVVVGRDQDEAGAMLNDRSRRNQLEANVWAGSAGSLTAWLQGLDRAGATWAVLVPSGPADRVELIADAVLPHIGHRASGMIPSHRLKRMKKALRREVRAARDGLAPLARAERSRRIAERLLALPELARAATVMAFSSFGSEVDTGPILGALAERGVRLALPRIGAGEISAVTYRPGDAATETPFGALEPSGGEVLEDAELDVVVTPGVAFDRRGFRVGYGAGYYDRLFLRTRPDAFRVAVGFALQVVEEVPRGGADLPVDAVVTEDEVIRCPRA